MYDVDGYVYTITLCVLKLSIRRLFILYWCRRPQPMNAGTV